MVFDSYTYNKHQDKQWSPVQSTGFIHILEILQNNDNRLLTSAIRLEITTDRHMHALTHTQEHAHR